MRMIRDYIISYFSNDLLARIPDILPIRLIHFNNIELVCYTIERKIIHECNLSCIYTFSM